MKKKSVSSIIATVLIVMLTVGAASILFVFIVPWIKDMLESSKICNDIQDGITIVEGKYTCYNATDTKVMIRVNSGKSVEGFIVSLFSSGKGKSYKILNGTMADEVSMNDGSAELIMPGAGGAETYVFNLAAESVDVAPLLLNGKTCKEVSQKLSDCSMI